MNKTAETTYPDQCGWVTCHGVLRKRQHKEKRAVPLLGFSLGIPQTKPSKGIARRVSVAYQAGQAGPLSRFAAA
jgi:hypothetical protein